jgi:tetratricopeptide (TPR) repeat protein
LIKERPREPQAHLTYAKLFVYRAEQEKYCEELACVNHRPGKNSLDIRSYEQFKQEIVATANLASSDEIERWKARGELIFYPTDKNIQMLKEVATTPDDHAAILSAIRQSGSEIDEPQNLNVGLLNPSYLIQLAYYYLKHDPVEGFNIARRIVDSQPVNPLVHVILTKLAQANESLESAYQYLKAALNIWEDEPRWHAEAAILAHTIGNDVDAVHHWEKALALEPEEAEYAIQLGHVYLARGKYREAIDKLNRAISCKPEDWNLWFMLASAYLKAGQLKEALDSSERSLKLNPSSARTLKQSGEIALGLDDKPKAFEYARGAVRIEPKNVEALILLSTVLERQGKPQDALAVLEHSINMIGKDNKLLMERARLVMETSGPRSALPFWEALSESDPENIEVLKMLSKAQIADGNLEQAENILHQALRLESNQPDIYLVMGKLQRKLGNLDKAIFYFNETINLEPSNVEGYIELALSYQERREYLQALNFYQQAIKISPNDDRPYYQAALVMREIKDYVGAEAMLRRAAKLSPDDLSVRRQLSAVIALNLVHNAREVTPFYEKR